MVGTAALHVADQQAEGATEGPEAAKGPGFSRFPSSNERLLL